MIERRLWLFEHVGRGLFTQLAVGWAALRGGEIRYAGGHPKILLFWRARLGMGRFDEFASRFAIEADTHLELFERMEERRADVENSRLFGSLRGFFPHEKLSTVVLKGLIAQSFFEFVLRQDAVRLRAEGRALHLFPRERRPFLKRWVPAAEPIIPLLWRVLLRLEDVFFHSFLLLSHGVGGILRLLKNGAVRRTPVPRPWGMAQITRTGLSPMALMWDSMIYDDGDLSPDQILHILKYPPSPEYKAYAKEKGLHVVYPRDLPVPGSFFGRATQALFGPVLAALISRGDRGMVRVAIRIVLDVLEAEILAVHHRFAVCFGFDCYWPTADVRALVWEKMGCRYIGHMFALPWLPAYSYQNTILPVFLCAGEGIKKVFGKTLAHVGRVIPMGLVSAEFALNRSAQEEEIRSKAPAKHIVAAYDSTYAPFWALTTEVFTIFYEGLLDLVEAHPTVCVFLKRKYTPEEQENPAYTAIAPRLAAHPRIRLIEKESAYGLMAAADSVVAITSSTTGWEGLCCRKPVFFFDPRPRYQIHPAAPFGPPLFCHTREELVEGMGRLLNGEYLNPATWAAAVRQEARFADERPLRHLKQFLKEEVRDQREANVDA